MLRADGGQVECFPVAETSMFDLAENSVPILFRFGLWDGACSRHPIQGLSPFPVLSQAIFAPSPYPMCRAPCPSARSRFPPRSSARLSVGGSASGVCGSEQESAVIPFSVASFICFLLSGECNFRPALSSFLFFILALMILAVWWGIFAIPMARWLLVLRPHFRLVLR